MTTKSLRRAFVVSARQIYRDPIV